MSNLQLYFFHFLCLAQKGTNLATFLPISACVWPRFNRNKYYQTKSKQEIHKIILTMVTSGNS